MQVEVCVFSVESCINAQRAGAHRVELCGGFYEGGTTPSQGLMQRARTVLSIQLYVMIRPRGGDFCYSEEEFEVMCLDILAAKKCGANGVVFGLLKPDGQVDRERTKELVELAKPMGVTFHRAMDVAADPFEALEEIIASGAERILTSGQQNTAVAGKDLLRRLVEKANGRIEIMAGSGVNADNALLLAETGVNALHLTGKAVRKGAMVYQKEGVSMASVLPADEYEIIYTNEANIKQLLNKIKGG
ncbi:copper homeostasis protein CutC [Runella slithyformis]|uniref:PF03932 family protein CutC n=1 Tax=Runella slithyformis (strain ATCC 29530 / DSM 19594 / LMG 11500 / NCIMB 11436 / LSU 4) TaxID=761193 RepID=A0A7U4E4Y8_RUNSL|nr:copper homeostasis protein CutC [Runella slithyformis]AEI48011.1 Copper homeostasis protein cutC [Runella slithyformis DSM 19594]